MRNFSKVVHVHHHSYSINFGEYRNEVNLMSVLRDLAKAFESPIDSLISEYTRISTMNSAFPTLLAPSEFDVLRDLYDFAHYANSGTEDKLYDIQHAFVYINLNTGASVTWFHTVV